MELKEVKIYSLIQVGPQVVVVLEEIHGPRLLPIWIGIYEGSAIGVVLSGQKFPRPLTHDLFVNILSGLKISVEKVTIVNLNEGTFFAEIHIKNGDKTVVVDARPSDSLAIALRMSVPVFVSEEVFKACPELLKPISDEEVDDFKKKLETMTPGDFLRDFGDKKDKDEA